MRRRLALSAMLALFCSCRPAPSEGPPQGQRDETAVAALLERVFTDQDSRPLRLRELAGKALVISHIYTSCPIQTMCPATTARMVELQQRMPQELLGSVHLVSITLDPERDPPAALKTYAEFYGADLLNWSFLGASARELEATAACCKVTFSLEENGMIGHDMNLVLVDPEGRIAAEFPGTDWAVPAVIARLRAMTAIE